jgi:membrane-associated phospholipid phosphatase
MVKWQRFGGTARFCVALLALGLATEASCKQGTGSDPVKPDTPAPQVQQASRMAADREVSLHKLPSNLLADQKEIWLFPMQLAKGKHWIPSVVIVGGSSALIATDAHTAPYFRNTDSFSGYNRVFSETNTGAFLAAVPAAIYTVGLIKKDSYTRNTALLAAEAFADGLALDLAFKGATGRKQPLQYTGNGPYSDSFFNGTHNPFHSGGFYSVHAMAATSIATVIAHRYRNHRWVPYVAYGLAGAICFSRITSSNHFPSDVFFGGAMGFVIARYAVLPAR